MKDAAEAGAAGQWAFNATQWPAHTMAAMHDGTSPFASGLARKALRSITDSPVNYARMISFIPAEKMDQPYNSRWHGKKSRQARRDGRQQGYDERFYNGGLPIVPIPMPLSFISYDAKNHPYRHGE
jgi:hypothetical protein